jgi:plastocyanin|tara:strand:+ start:552 stop:1016 length:465 start_codon:yes stop_codon:yes gene_type:complete
MKQFRILLLVILALACSSDSGDDGYGQNNNGYGNNNNNNNNNNQSSATSYSISVSPNGMSDYSLSGKDRNGSVSGNDPSLNFKVGDQITFSVSAGGHPFYLKTQSGTGTGNQISGVTNNGATNGNVTWKPSSAGTYYYVCSLHGNMYGVITIAD